MTTTAQKRYLSSKTVTKASSFLLPTIPVAYGMIKNYGFVNAYIADRSKPDKYPRECLYLLFNTSVENDLNEIADYLRDSDHFVDEYDPDDEHVVFVIRMTDRWKHLYDLFLEGQYSLFDKEYIDQYYPRRIVSGYDPFTGQPTVKESVNHLILTRDESLKKEIEEDLRVTLEDKYDYETGKMRYYQVHSKPDLAFESL